MSWVRFPSPAPINPLISKAFLFCRWSRISPVPATVSIGCSGPALRDSIFSALGQSGFRQSIIGCDIHPLHNVSPLNHLRKVFGRSEQEIADWISVWLGSGFSAVDARIGEGFCFGPEPSMADVYLLPQLYAARRFAVPLDAYPRILRVEKLAGEHQAFRSAHPSAQPDAE